MEFSHLAVSYLARTVWTVAGSMYFEELYSRYMAITGPLLRKLIACLFIVTALPRGSQNLGQGCMHVRYLRITRAFPLIIIGRIAYKYSGLCRPAVTRRR